MTAAAESVVPSPGTRVALRPLGLLHGAAAAAALETGLALPLGGGPEAFTACGVWLRHPAREEARRTVVPVRDLRDWAAGQPDASVAEGIGVLLDRLATRPAALPGLPGDRRPLIMGVVNVTPDSFSDGGIALDPRAAVDRGRRLHAEGADIIDVGGESTRPGADPAPQEEELRRVLPVVEALAAEGVFVSIDTRKAAVMRAAIAAGARMLNDVSALAHDPDALAVAAASGLPVVLMHMRGEPATMQRHATYRRAALEVYDELEARIEACERAGLPRARLVVDPGIGFAKLLEHNLEVLHGLGLYLGLGAPLLLGVSRKSFVARVLGDEVPADRRLPGSLAAALWGVGQGVHVLRVHDVAETQQAVAVWRAIAAGEAPSAGRGGRDAHAT